MLQIKKQKQKQTSIITYNMTWLGGWVLKAIIREVLK